VGEFGVNFQKVAFFTAAPKFTTWIWTIKRTLQSGELLVC